MKNSILTEEVLLSWKRCIEYKVSPNTIPLKTNTENEAFKVLLNKNSHLIFTFEQITSSLKYLTTSYIFLY